MSEREKERERETETETETETEAEGERERKRNGQKKKRHRYRDIQTNKHTDTDRQRRTYHHFTKHGIGGLNHGAGKRYLPFNHSSNEAFQSDPVAQAQHLCLCVLRLLLTEDQAGLADPLLELVNGGFHAVQALCSLPSLTVQLLHLRGKFVCLLCT